MLRNQYIIYILPSTVCKIKIIYHFIPNFLLYTISFTVTVQQGEFVEACFTGSQKPLILTLNRKLPGWACYHRITDAGEAFNRIDRASKPRRREKCTSCILSANDQSVPFHLTANTSSDIVSFGDLSETGQWSEQKIST